MRRAREPGRRAPGGTMTVGTVAIALGLLAALVCPGAAGAAEALRGTSDGVAWSVQIVQTRLRAQQALRWDYEVVMRETRGRDIQFEQVELGVGGRMTRAVPVKVRLAARGEVRTKHWDRSPSG